MIDKGLKKKIGNGVFFVLLLLFLVPATRTQIQIFLTRYISFSPGLVTEDSREVLTAYDWDLKGVNTENLDFETTKGEVVLVNFWATWCPPCIAEMPSMQKLYDRYKDKAHFVFVSNEVDSVLHKFMRTKEYDFPIYRAISNTPPLLYGKSLPTTYLLDKKGALVINKVGAADWDSDTVHKTIDKLLAE